MLTGLPRHVFMTTDAVGGVWTYARDLSEGLAAKGVRVTLACLGPAPRVDRRAEIERIAGVELIDTDVPLDWLETDPDALMRGGMRLARLALQSGADLVHLNSPTYAVAGFSAPVVGACHSCLASWWEAVRGGEMPTPFRAATERQRAGYLACDALIAPSAAFARTTAEIYGVHVVAAPNGRADRSPPAATPKEPFVLTAGRLWDEGKNVRALDRAAAQMNGRVEAAGPLAGPNDERTTLRAIRPLGLLGERALAERFARCSVFASLALYEPFGLAVLEAAQAGCALVLSDIPTFRELWDGAAVFVDHRDPAAVAATLERLLADRSECARLGALAHARTGCFTVGGMVERTLDVYRSASRHAALRGAAA